MKRRREETRHSSDSLARRPARLDISSTSRAAGDHPITRHALAKKRAKAINSALGVWFPRVHDTRGMPWRKPYNPTLSSEARGQRAYEVWVSEIMLQQTRVETVIPYYNKWMQQFPTVRDLAASNEETINCLWKGLGYYGRAARLLSGAQMVVETYDGLLPEDPAVLEKQIAGIGKYTAGAITSIAYGVCAPVLDGNVERLLSRVLAIRAPPKSKATLDLLWSAAAQIVANSPVPGAINQALIELGSTMCTPLNPKCGGCPVKEECTAYALQSKIAQDEVGAIADIEDLCSKCEAIPEGQNAQVTDFPLKVKKQEVPKVTDVLCVVKFKSKNSGSSKDAKTKVLIRKRPAKGLLAGLWDFPVVPDVPPSPYSPTSTFESQAYKLIKTAIPSCSSSTSRIQIISARHVGSVEHIFSHVRKTFEVVIVELESESDDEPGVEWSVFVDERPNEDDNERVKKPAKKKRKFDKSQEKEGEGEEKAKWVVENEVANANLGTGTMKVWHLAQNGGAAVKKTKGKAKARIETKDTNIQTKLTFQKVVRVKKGVIESDDDE